MFVALVLAAALQSAPPAQPSCPVTLPKRSDAHANEAISTGLWPDGTVVFRKGGPGYVLDDGSLQMKFLWTLTVAGPLTVTGKRIDASAPPLRSDIPPGFVGQGFQPSYLIFPTQGCW